MPAVIDGPSFIEIKVLEHTELNLGGQVFVCPVGKKETFRNFLTDLSLDSTKAKGKGTSLKDRTVILEQGPELSTIRFESNGSPFLDAAGRPSLVPAGHGALGALLPKVKQQLPHCETVFIRNIDNINGTNAAIQKTTRSFLEIHAGIRKLVAKVRRELGAGELLKAAAAVTPLAKLASTSSCNQTNYQPSEKLSHARNPGDLASRSYGSVKGPKFTLPSAAACLSYTDPFAVQLELGSAVDNSLDRTTQAQLAEDANSLSVKVLSEETKTLLQYYSRPFNLFGQVPNTGKDVGGTPCFIRSKDQHHKVCVEVPHVSVPDRQKYFEDPTKATHFNPVFVAAELYDNPEQYSSRDSAYWLQAEKTFRGKPVTYYETVLYELLGNSAFANVIFVEIPRDLFHPHKTVKDGNGRTLADWV